MSDNSTALNSTALPGMSDNSTMLPTGPSDFDIALYQGFIAETVAFGLYFGLFIFTMLKWRKISQNVPMFALTTVLFLTCGAHYGTTVYPVYVQDIGVNGLTNISFISNTNQYIVGSLAFALANFLGDITIIYRLWNFYQRKYLVIIIPFLLSLAGFVLNVASSILLISGPDGTPAVSDNTIINMSLASYICPLITNLFVTGFITGRIWIMVKRQGDDTMSTPARRAVATIVESGLLFFLIQLVLTVVVNFEVPAQIPIAAVAVQIYGIAPTLITAGINSGVLFTSKGGVPSVTGPLATTHINVNKDSYVMTHLSENWSEFDQDSHRDKESLAARDDKSAISVEKQ
jgi:hypothetical protein